MQIQGEGAQWWPMGEGVEFFGVKEGITLCEGCSLMVQNRNEIEAFEFCPFGSSAKVCSYTMLAG